MAKKTAWTPYGLEAIRIAHLRRRRLFALLAALGAALVWASFFESTTERSVDVSTDGGGSSIEIDVSDAQRQNRNDKITVSISPGRVTRAETGSGATEPGVTRFNVPTFERDAPIPWAFYLLRFGPFVLIGLGLWLMRKRKSNEINYGVYKGAMPLEMMSASASKHIFTTRHAKSSVFGKRRSDYLPAQMLPIERVPQEDDT